MIRPLATFIHVLDAARTAGTLARTVLVLSRQLDNAHLLAASEEARADRAELRVAELEAALQDWREASGELAREQPAADPLPDLTDAGEVPIPLVLTDSAREADIQRDRADALQAALRAAKVELVETRARLTQTERAAGAHIATIGDLQTRLAWALRAVHRPSAEQIPGVAAADDPPTCDACGKPVRDGERTGEAEAVLLCGRCRAKAEAEEAARTSATLTLAAHGNDPQRGTAATAAYRATIEAARATAGTEIEPPTRPSERAATRTT